MQRESTWRSTPYERTDTPGIYRRGSSYTVKWREDRKARYRTFSTYEEACAFRRDVVLPFRAHGAVAPTAITPCRREDGWVYFFQSRGAEGLVKIGWSSHPAQRLQDLASAHPDGLDLVALLPGSAQTERLLHEAFAAWRVKGEWFSRDALPAIRNVLADAARAASSRQ